MKEVEVLQQVKQYMDHLIQGVDPIGGEIFPSDSILRQEKLVKCFQYVSIKLQEELKRQKEQELEAKVASEPILMKTFMTNIIKELGFTGYYLLSAASNWLVQEGYLASEKVQDENSSLTVYTVTAKGSIMGFSKAKAQQDASHSILCDESAQKLLKSNMDKIMEFERKQWEPLLNCLTAEWCSRVSCFQEPITLTILLKQINSQLPVNLPRKLNVVSVYSWMVRKDLMEDVFINGRKVRWPTWKGKQIGISAKKKSVLWATSAQQFILDNLKSIVQDLASGDAFRLGIAPQKLTEVEKVQAQVIYNSQGESLYELENKINQAFASIKEEHYKLPRRVILAWLHNQNYIKAVNQDGTTQKIWVPTDTGRTVGLYIGENGYLAVNEAVQHLVVEHLEEIWNFYQIQVQKCQNNR